MKTKSLPKQFFKSAILASWILMLVIVSSCSKGDKDLEGVSLNPKPYNKEKVAALTKTFRQSSQILAAQRKIKPNNNSKLLPLDEVQYEDSLFSLHGDEFKSTYLAYKESTPVKNFTAGLESWPDTYVAVNGIEKNKLITPIKG